MTAAVNLNTRKFPECFFLIVNLQVFIDALELAMCVVNYLQVFANFFLGVSFLLGKLKVRAKTIVMVELQAVGIRVGPAYILKTKCLRN